MIWFLMFLFQTTILRNITVTIYKHVHDIMVKELNCIAITHMLKFCLDSKILNQLFFIITNFLVLNKYVCLVFFFLLNSANAGNKTKQKIHRCRFQHLTFNYKCDNLDNLTRKCLVSCKNSSMASSSFPLDGLYRPKHCCCNCRINLVNEKKKCTI